MAARYFLTVDDEPGILDAYRQYLSPARPPASSALERLRRLKGAGEPSSRAPGLLPPGWELAVAGSGEEALALAAEIAARGDEICVGLFDVKMPPGIDGIEVMLRLLERFPRMRCGVVSAYNDRSVDEINALFAPEHQDRWDFISKPFTEPEIRQKARMLISTFLHAVETEDHRAGLQWLVDAMLDLAAREGSALGSALVEHVERFAPPPRWRWAEPAAAAIDFAPALTGRALHVPPEATDRERKLLTALREAAVAHATRAAALSELEQLNAQLEARVAQRTRELTELTEELARSESRMRIELDAAAAIQMNLYPKCWPTIAGMQLASHIETTAETGGDICGYILPSEDQIGIYICDVTGHGASAALGTAILCGTLKAIEQELRAIPARRVSPGEILGRLNAAVRHATRGSLYATFFLGVIDLRTYRMRYASAGHEWPLVARETGVTVVPLLAAPVLGELAEPAYADLETALHPGDVLLLYTDGLTDAKDPTGRPYDRRRLFKALASAPRDSADAVKDAIHTAFRSTVPSASALEDDITYVVVRVSETAHVPLRTG